MPWDEQGCSRSSLHGPPCTADPPALRHLCYGSVEEFCCGIKMHDSVMLIYSMATIHANSYHQHRTQPHTTQPLRGSCKVRWFYRVVWAHMGSSSRSMTGMCRYSRPWACLLSLVGHKSWHHMRDGARVQGKQSWDQEPVLMTCAGLGLNPGYM